MCYFILIGEAYVCMGQLYAPLTCQRGSKVVLHESAGVYSLHLLSTYLLLKILGQTVSTNKVYF